MANHSNHDEYSCYDAISAGVLVQDRRGELVYVNDAGLRIMGIPRREREDWAEFLRTTQLIREDGTDLPPEEQPSMAALKTGQSVHGVVVGLRKLDTQEVRWVLVDSEPVPDASGQIATVISTFFDITDGKQAEHEQKRLNRQLRMLSDVNEAVIHATDEDELLGDVCRIVVDVGGHTLAWVAYAEDDPEKTVRIVAHCGLAPTNIDEMSISWADTDKGSGPTGTAIRTGKPCIIPEVSDMHYMPWKAPLDEHKYRSAVGLPLTAEGKTFGALTIYSAQLGVFTPEEFDLLEELAGDLAFGIAGVRVRAQRSQVQGALKLTQFSVDRASDMVYWIGPDASIVYVNESAARALGYTREELLSMSIPDIDPDYTVQRWPAHFAELKERGSMKFESRHRRKDGSIFPVEISANYGEFGGKEYNFAFIRDVSERKNAEEKTRLNEARLEALLKLTQMTQATTQEIADFALEEGVKLTRSQMGYLAFVNEDETILQMYSWSKSALAICSVSDKPRIYAVKDTGLWGEAIRQRKPVITNDYSAPNPLKKGVPEGHVRLTRHMNIPVFDGGRIVVVAGVSNKEEDYDLSDIRQLTLLMSGMWRILRRNQAEQELVESEERYRVLFERSPDMVFLVEDGKFTAINPAVTRILGYQPDEVIGKYPWEISPEYQPGGRRSEDEARRILGQLHDTGPQTFEWIHQHKDGSPVECEVSLVEYRFQDKMHVQAIIRDVTERKRAEENRRKFEKQIEAQKRRFYRDTIMSVTNAKLDICDAADIRPYISSASLSIEVSEPSEVSHARREVESFLRENGLDEDRLAAFIIGVGEAITNAVKHAPQGRVYAGVKDGSVWVGVSDRGPGIGSLILPRATLLRGFSTKPSLGLGYSIMLEVSDHILLKTGDHGTTVVLIKKLEEPAVRISPDRLPDTWQNIP